MSTTASDRQLITIVLVLLGALVILPVLFMGVGMLGGPMMGGGWGHGMWGQDGTAPGWAVAAGLVMQVLFLAVIVATGYLIYRGVTRRTEGRDPALEELRLAYARGDLSEEEFDARRERLKEER